MEKRRNLAACRHLTDELVLHSLQQCLVGIFRLHGSRAFPCQHGAYQMLPAAWQRTYETCMNAKCDLCVSSLHCCKNACLAYGLVWKKKKIIRVRIFQKLSRSEYFLITVFQHYVVLPEKTFYTYSSFLFNITES